MVPASDGCEEIETVAIIDILRRAGAIVDFVSITDNLLLKGSNGISIMTDDLLKNKINQNYDLIALPGGVQNAKSLSACNILIEKLKK